MSYEISQVIDNIKEKSGAKTDTAVAKLLGMSRDNLAGHKKRGVIPYGALHDYCVEAGVSFDELLGIEEAGTLDESVRQKYIDRINELEEMVVVYKEMNQLLKDKVDMLRTAAGLDS